MKLICKTVRTPILFRGQEFSTRKWAYGNYYFDSSNLTHPYSITWNGKDSLGDFDFDNEFNAVKVIESTIGQYTGLEDKNGTKIFEGDIVRVSLAYRDIICCVKWDDCGFILEIIDNSDYRYYLGKCFELEVIGNEFDNPDLEEQ